MAFFSLTNTNCKENRLIICALFGVRTHQSLGVSPQQEHSATSADVFIAIHISLSSHTLSFVLCSFCPTLQHLGLPHVWIFLNMYEI